MLTKAGSLSSLSLMAATSPAIGEKSSDTAFTASKVVEQAAGRVKVAHVPKTIDNDLPLPGGIPTFGYMTARSLGVTIVKSLNEDARTTGRWYFVVAMGRKAGQLAEPRREGRRCHQGAGTPYGARGHHRECPARPRTAPARTAAFRNS